MRRGGRAPEPPAGSALSTSNVAVRLRDGRRASRRFEVSSPLQHVVDWIGGVTPDSGTFRLASSYPRRVFGQAELELSLADLGLQPAATLVIEEDEDEEDE